MKYYSTNRLTPLVDFKEATIAGLAPDKGLFFPDTIPAVDRSLINGLRCVSNSEIALNVLKPYVGDTIPEGDFQRIVTDTVNFDIPLVSINHKISSLELFHGPTFAFKDLGARFMSRCMGYFAQEVSKKMTVLVATSGDTGGAVANGFYDVPGVEVVILYPSKKVSDLQEKQLTTLGKNIHALEVNGSFDDCQRMVKEAFADNQLRDKLFLTSANSINVARWIPQQLFYFFGYKQWPSEKGLPIVAVPSGNFGNLTAGILARLSGLPFFKFIVACNANKSVVEYLRTGTYTPTATIPTISNAMDVGNPSNFVRLTELYGRNYAAITHSMKGYTIDDIDTQYIMEDVQKRHGYQLDPHGAVAYCALERYLKHHPNRYGYLLETAHPVKFDESLQQSSTLSPELQHKIADLQNGKKQSVIIDPDYSQLKDFLMR